MVYLFKTRRPIRGNHVTRVTHPYSPFFPPSHTFTRTCSNMDIRITTERGSDTITTTVNGRRIEREEKWHITVIEPREATVIPGPEQEVDQGWSTVERVAAGISVIALVLFGWYALLLICEGQRAYPEQVWMIVCRSTLARTHSA